MRVLSRWKRRLRGTLWHHALVLFFLLAVSTIVGAEAAIRVTGLFETYTERIGQPYESPYAQHQERPWILVDDARQRCPSDRKEFDFEIRTNGEGLRDIDHPVTKPEGEYRIVGIGDSFTMGLGAAFRDTYLRVLKRRLEARSPGRSFRTLCGGVSGSDPVYGYQLLKRRLLKYGPDLVILLLNDSDVGDLIIRGGMDRYDSEGWIRGNARPRSDWLFARSHLVRGVLIGFLDYDYYLMAPEERACAQHMALDGILEAAEAMQRLGETEGFRLLVVAQEDAWERLEGTVSSPADAVAGRFRARGIPYADLNRLFRQARQREPSRKLYWPTDGHCTAEGYALIAQGVETAIVEAVCREGCPWE